jgi:putative transposase
MIRKAICILIGLCMEDRRDVLGMYISGIESALFWLTVLNYLKNRGVADMPIVSEDSSISPFQLLFFCFFNRSLIILG